MPMLKSIINLRTSILQQTCNIEEAEARKIASGVTYCYPLLSEDRFTSFARKLSVSYGQLYEMLVSDRPEDVQNAYRLVTMPLARCMA